MKKFKVSVAPEIFDDASNDKEAQAALEVFLKDVTTAVSGLTENSSQEDLFKALEKFGITDIEAMDADEVIPGFDDNVVIPLPTVH